MQLFYHGVKIQVPRCRLCGFVAKGKTEDEILVQCAVHATKDHNMKPEEVTEELKNKIRANIHKSWF